MKRCPECGARIKNRSAVRCPACTAPLPAPRPSVGKHEIQSKSGRKPLIVSDRRISSETENAANRRHKAAQQNVKETMPRFGPKRISDKTARDDSLYSGYVRLFPFPQSILAIPLRSTSPGIFPFMSAMGYK